MALVEADVGATGADGRRLEALLRRSLAWGRERFADLAGRALRRQLRQGKSPLVWSRVFDDAERAELADLLAALRATGELLGRVLLRDKFRLEVVRVEPVAESALRESLSAPFEPLPPEKALAYFRGLYRPAVQPGEVAVYRGVTTPGRAAPGLAGIPQAFPGDYGTGQYWTSDYSAAQSYAAGPDGTSAGFILRGAVKPGAVVKTAREVEALHQQAIASGAARPEEDMGHFAARMGIDVISVPDKRYLVIVRPEAVRYAQAPDPLLKPDPLRWGDDLRRHAFSLAGDVDQQLLGAVHGVIRDRLETGRDIRGATRDVQELLDAAGVSPKNPQYAEAVVRTNLMDAYNQGHQEEMSDPDVREMFPVWMYSNPDDTRSRKEHADRDGKYYPNGVPFVQVRGTEAKDVVNCRCVPIAVSKFRWRALRARGARIADGYPDVLAEEGSVGR